MIKLTKNENNPSGEPLATYVVQNNTQKRRYRKRIEITIGFWDKDGAQHGERTLYYIRERDTNVYRVLKYGEATYRNQKIITINGECCVIHCTLFNFLYANKIIKNVKTLLDSIQDVKRIHINLYDGKLQYSKHWFSFNKYTLEDYKIINPSK